MKKLLGNSVLAAMAMSLLYACDGIPPPEKQKVLEGYLYSLFSTTKTLDGLNGVRVKINDDEWIFQSDLDLMNLQAYFSGARLSSNDKNIRDHGWRRKRVGGIQLLANEGEMSYEIYESTTKSGLYCVRINEIQGRGASLLFLNLKPNELTKIITRRRGQNSQGQVNYPTIRP